MPHRRHESWLTMDEFEDEVEMTPWTRPRFTGSRQETKRLSTAGAPIAGSTVGLKERPKDLESATTADTSEKALKGEGNPTPITGFKLFAILGSVTLAAFLMLLDGSIIGVAIPIITTEFHSLDDVGWYTAAYQLASAALQPLSGKIYTSYSTKWSYLIFFGIFELGSLICGVASSSTMLIGGRAIAGMGSSGLLNGGMTMIASAVPLEKRPVYTGIYLGISQVGIVCGPLLGGALTEFTSWRWCFYINLPVGAITAILLVILKVPELTAKPQLTLSHVRKTIPELDLIGFTLFAPASIMVLLALHYGDNTYPWNSSVVIGLFCGAGAIFILFVFWERRMGDRAMIPPSMVSQRIVYSSAINGSALVASILVAAQYLPIYFQGVLEYSPSISGVNTLPGILSQLFTVILSGGLVQKVGYYLPFAVAGSAISAVGNGLVSTFGPHTKTATWIGYQIILGSGRGIGMQIGIIAIQNVLPPQKIPIGIAFMIFCQNFAGAVFVVVGEVIFTQRLVKEIKAHAPSVSVGKALAAGASSTAVRKLVPARSPKLAGVLLAYANSLDKVFLLLMACCLAGLIAAYGMGWVDTRPKKAAKEVNGALNTGKDLPPLPESSATSQPSPSLIRQPSYLEPSLFGRPSSTQHTSYLESSLFERPSSTQHASHLERFPSQRHLSRSRRANHLELSSSQRHRSRSRTRSRRATQLPPSSIRRPESSIRRASLLSQNRGSLVW